MARTKANVRRLNRPTIVAALGQKNNEQKTIYVKNIKNRRQSMFKTKALSPQIKPVEVKKDWLSI